MVPSFRNTIAASAVFVDNVEPRGIGMWNFGHYDGWECGPEGDFWGQYALNCLPDEVAGGLRWETGIRRHDPF